MNDLVIAALVAGPLSSGEPGFIGVQYTIKPGWHIYWENPGESGIPTEVMSSQCKKAEASASPKGDHLEGTHLRSSL